MITKTIYENEFSEELSSNKDNGFTYEGASLLYEYLEDFEEPIEFDTVAFRCEYSEYTIEEYIKENEEHYNEYKEENEDEDEIKTNYYEEFVKFDDRFAIGDDEECFILFN